MHCGTRANATTNATKYYVVVYTYTEAQLFSAEVKRRGFVPPLNTAEDYKKWNVRAVTTINFLGAYRTEEVEFKDGSKWIRNARFKKLKEKRDAV